MTFRPDPRRRRASLLRLAALALVVAAFPVLAAEDASPAQPAYDRAENFAEAQNYRAARIELLNAVQEDPDWAPAHVALAIAQLRLFDAVGAEAELYEALRLGTPTGRLRHLLGESYWLQGRYREAMAQLEAGDIDPEHRAYAARIAGRVFLDLGNMAIARGWFDRALAEGEAGATLWTDIGRFRLVAGDIGGAIEAADRAIAIGARDTRALQFRGRVVRLQFGMAAALPWFERGLAITPDDVPLLVEYGATLGDMGRHVDMLKVARKIAALDPANPQSYFMQAVIAARAHNFALAQRLIAKTEGRMDDVPAMLLLGGSVEYGLGNDLVAAELWSRLSDMQPLNETARALTARALYRAGDAGGAIERLTGGDLGSYGETVLARALEVEGDRDAAMTMLNRAQTLGDPVAALFPAEGDGPAAAVRARVAEGDPGGALAEALDMQRRNPGVPDAHMLVGDLLAETGDFGGAMEAYGRAGALQFSVPLMARMAAAAGASGDRAAVRAVLARFLGLNPASLTARRLLADEYLDGGNFAAAARLYGDLLAVTGPNDAVVQANYARALLAAGDSDRALEHARIAYRVQPGNPVAVHVYGYVALKAGRTAEAVELLEKAVTLLPDNALARGHLAQAKAAARSAA